MTAPLYAFFVARRRQAWPYLVAILMLTSFSLASCASPFGNSGAPTATSTPSQLALAKLRWCGKALMVFRDEGVPPTPTAGTTPTAGATPTGTPVAGTTPTVTPGQGTPTTLTDWAEVQSLLGFTVYLPATLPPNTCLVSALGTVNDPVFGGSFTIGYLLPNRNSISLSEAPLRNQKPLFQCSSATTPTPQVSGTPKAGTPVASPTQTPNQVCSGARDQTNIVFSAPGNMDSLQKFFNALQPNVKWVPAS